MDGSKGKRFRNKFGMTEEGRIRNDAGGRGWTGPAVKALVKTRRPSS